MFLNSVKNTNQYTNILKQYSSGDISAPEKDCETNSIRKAEYMLRARDKSKGIAEEAFSYANQLRGQRTKQKAASLEKKKLQYNFKKISSQILRSKNSVSARKAVQAARHEVARLKRLKGNGEYDDEELQLAIDHAKAMEQVAKKRVVHLEQEEMIERHGKGLAIDMDEIKKQQEGSEDENIEDESLEEGSAEDNELTDEDMTMAEELMEAEWDVDDEYLPEEFSMSMEEMQSELDLSDEMNQMLEDMGLDELAESTYAPDPNMSEEDLKKLKIKHRTKEMKEIAEADKEYLKGLMKHEKNKQAAIAGMSGGNGSMNSVLGKSEETVMRPVISMPGAAAGATTVAPTISGGFNVSV